MVEDAVRSVEVPKGVELRRIAFDNDFGGDPAIRVVYGITRRIALTKARVRELTDFKLAVGDRIWSLQTGRIPYVTFAEAA